MAKQDSKMIAAAKRKAILESRREVARLKAELARIIDGKRSSQGKNQPRDGL